MENSPSAAAEFISVLTNIITAIAALGGVLIAWSALHTWKAQIRGQATFDTARKLVVSANKLALYFNAARSSFASAEEFPQAYNEMPLDERKSSDEAKAWRQVFNSRWKPVGRCYGRVVALLPETRAFFPKEVFEAAEQLLLTARKLSNAMHTYTRLIAERDNVPYLSEAARESYDKRMRSAEDDVFSDVWNFDDPSENELSRQFMNCHSELIRLLRPALHLE